MVALPCTGSRVSGFQTPSKTDPSANLLALGLWWTAGSEAVLGAGAGAGFPFATGFFPFAFTAFGDAGFAGGAFGDGDAAVFRWVGLAGGVAGELELGELSTFAIALNNDAMPMYSDLREVTGNEPQKNILPQYCSAGTGCWRVRSFRP